MRHAQQHTVADAVDAYVRWLAQHRKTAADAKSRLKTYVTDSPIGKQQLAALRPADFVEWSIWALAHKPRGRLKTGKQAKGKRQALGADVARRRKATVNRIINYLLAALNRAHETGRVPSREAWSGLRKFRGVDNARIARLDAEQARKLVLAADPDFSRLVHGALITGCRYGELCALRVRDVVGATLVADSKATRPRRVPLTESGQALFTGLMQDKGPDDLVFVKTDGTAWGKSEQQRRMAAACAAAGISPAVGFHALRHTFASLLVEAEMPLAFVAEALGHADTRMVSKHYQHLTPSIVQDSIRANLPDFGANPSNYTDAK